LDLKGYERMKIKNIIKPIFMKEKCENCGINKNLELHHHTQFAKMLKETLDRLGYSYKSMTEDYTNEQLENITDMLLGIHIRSMFSTLCDECHSKIHTSGKLIIHYLKEKKIKEENDLDRLKLNTIIDRFINTKMFKNEQIIFKELLNQLFNPPKRSHGSIGLKTINSFFKDNNINFFVLSKTETTRKSGNHKKVYWIISENKFIQ